MRISKMLISVLVVVAGLLFLSASNVLAQDFCKGLADYDQDVDADDVEEFLNHFGRHQFNNPCPPDGPAPVEKTGQTFCSNSEGAPVECEFTGQDGEHQKGVEWPNPRFTNNGDGTVTDNLTGLIWLRDANCSIFNAPRSWSDALNIIVPQLEDGYCGLSDGSSAGDWRIPNKRELFSLVHDGYYGPALSNTSGTGHHSDGDPYYNVLDFWYLTSTTHAAATETAWSVHMRYGTVEGYSKSDAGFVWPVRGGY